MNVIARLEFELAYYDSAVHRFNHYTTRTPRNKCPEYDKNNLMVRLQSWRFGDCGVLFYCQLFSGSYWLGVVAPDRDLSADQIELFDIWTVRKLITYTKLNCWNRIFDHLIVWRHMTENCLWYKAIFWPLELCKRMSNVE